MLPLSHQEPVLQPRSAAARPVGSPANFQILPEGLQDPRPEPGINIIKLFLP